jgi:deazaflavin-dependent oxidoreductase (nitroreductase family)
MTCTSTVTVNPPGVRDLPGQDGAHPGPREAADPDHRRRQPRRRPVAAHRGLLTTDRRDLARLAGMPDNYRAPGWFTRNVLNQVVALLTRQGISVLGSRVLAVKGRTSGQWRTTPVNLLTHDGHRYLVAPRGETQWVRNLRVVGTGELRVGRRAEGFRGRELTDDEKVPVLRAYLKRWKAEVGIFFEGTGPDSSDDQIRAIAPKHPAFEVLPVE